MRSTNQFLKKSFSNADLATLDLPPANELSDILFFFDKNIDFFIAPLLTSEKFNLWGSRLTDERIAAKKNTKTDFKVEIEENLASILKEFSHALKIALSERQHIFARYADALYGASFPLYFKDCLKSINPCYEKMLSLLEFNATFFDVMKNYTKDKPFLMLINKWYQEEASEEHKKARDLTIKSAMNKRFSLRQIINTSYFSIPYGQRKEMANDYLMRLYAGWQPYKVRADIAILQQKIVAFLPPEQCTKKATQRLLDTCAKEIAKLDIESLLEIKKLAEEKYILLQSIAQNIAVIPKKDNTIVTDKKLAKENNAISSFYNKKY